MSLNMPIAQAQLFSDSYKEIETLELQIVVILGNFIIFAFVEPSFLLKLERDANHSDFFLSERADSPFLCATFFVVVALTRPR